MAKQHLIFYYTWFRHKIFKRYTVLLFSGEMCYLAAMTGSLLSVTERKKRGKDIKQRLLLLHK